MQARTALVHHWLVTMRGGERVFEALAQLFPSADLFTLVCDRAKMPQSFGGRHIHSSFLQHFPRATQWYRYYLPLFPYATEQLDLAGYDLIVSSDAATVKGVRGGSATHICYCHTPMRYVWSGYETYRRMAGSLSRRALGAFRKSLCRWDYEAAQRVTLFVANSRNVQKRIRECYGRDSCVIYPPVDTERFSIGAETGPENHFLVVSPLVSYKRVDLLVDAFNKCRRNLIVIGDGPDRHKLQRRAGPTVRFLGAQPDAVVVASMQRCRAFVFAGEEDFGIVMAEAHTCGKPVIAFGRGGACEIVDPGRTGVLFEEQTPESLIDALERFDRWAYDPLAVRRSALRFSRERFFREFRQLVDPKSGPGPSFPNFLPPSVAAHDRIR